MVKTVAMRESRADQLLALQDELDQLEGRGRHRMTIIPVSFFGGILLFGYGSVMLEVFGALFLGVAASLLVGDVKVGRRKNELRELIAEFGKGDDGSSPSA